MRFGPRDRIGGSPLGFGRLRVESRAKTPVVDDEGLIPLVHHLVNLPNHRHCEPECFHKKARHRGEPYVAAKITRKARHERAHRLGRRAREHPGLAVRIVAGGPQRRQPHATSGT